MSGSNKTRNPIGINLKAKFECGFGPADTKRIALQQFNKQNERLETNTRSPNEQKTKQQQESEDECAGREKWPQLKLNKRNKCKKTAPESKY